MVTSPRRVVMYRRVSTKEQGDSGAGLAAQASVIEREAAARDWEIVARFHDVASGKSLDRRPQLESAIRAVQQGPGKTLVVSKLDRLSRSTVDFGGMMEKARSEGWSIVIIDLAIDLSTPAGEMIATIMASLAQWERRMISDRTRDALAEKRASGVTLGRPTGMSADSESVIRALRASGLGYRVIAAELARLNIPTAQGGKWHPATVRKMLTRLAS